MLILFKEHPETRGEHFPCSAFRWAFEAGRWHIGFVHQHKWKESGKWQSSHTSVYEMYISKHFAVGDTHLYYDGPHCMFSLGWIHFIWGNSNCKKCLGDR